MIQQSQQPVVFAWFPPYLRAMLGSRVRLRIIAGIVCLFGSAGCRPSPPPARTTVSQAWRNPDFAGEAFSELFVIGVGRNDDYRRLYEDSMVHALQEEGVMAQASWTLFPETGKLDRLRVLVAVERAGFDAVVIARLREVREQEELVPARPATSSDLYMAGYDQAYAVNSAPAYYRTNRNYRVETSIYDLRHGILARVYLSDTLNPDSVDELIHSVSARIVEQMKTEGLIQ